MDVAIFQVLASQVLTGTNVSVGDITPLLLIAFVVKQVFTKVTTFKVRFGNAEVEIRTRATTEK